MSVARRDRRIIARSINLAVSERNLKVSHFIIARAMDKYSLPFVKRAFYIRGLLAAIWNLTPILSINARGIIGRRRARLSH